MGINSKGTWNLAKNIQKMIKACILRSELEDSPRRWIDSCQKLGVSYEVINLLQDDWFEKIEANDSNFYLACPSGIQEHLKRVYDEKLYVVETVLHKKVFPSYNEIIIYENKRFFSYFAKAYEIPVPSTHVFYIEEEALSYVENVTFPLVAKTSIGAAGTGVNILHDSKQARQYIHIAFSEGIKRKSGPSLSGRSRTELITKALKSPEFLFSKIKSYRHLNDFRQKGYVIFQEFIDHKFEWRVIKIGESLFAHQKVKMGEMASGTKLKNYVKPPLELLDFVNDLCERLGFDIMACDIFENNGSYIVNEMQTKWGQKYDYLMEIDGRRGRYVKRGCEWVFEEGDFNRNASFDLKLKYILTTIHNGE